MSLMMVKQTLKM